jgi:hypothetical protein
VELRPRESATSITLVLSSPQNSLTARPVSALPNWKYRKPSLSYLQILSVSDSKLIPFRISQEGPKSITFVYFSGNNLGASKVIWVVYLKGSLAVEKVRIARVINL